MLFQAAAMTFSMMFGSHQNSNDEYSSDDEGNGSANNGPNGGYYDDDENDEYLDDDEEEDDENYPALSDGPSKSSGGAVWEAPAKIHSNMNLKDQVVKSRIEEEKGESVLKKMKQAKKRADKRRKQREKRKEESTTTTTLTDCKANNTLEADFDSTVNFTPSAAVKAAVESVDLSSVPAENLERSLLLPFLPPSHF